MKPFDTISRYASQTLGYFIDPRGAGGVVEKIYPIGCTKDASGLDHAALHVEVRNSLANPVNINMPSPLIVENTNQNLLLPDFGEYGVDNFVVGAGGVLTYAGWFDIDTPSNFWLFVSNIGANASNGFGLQVASGLSGAGIVATLNGSLSTTPTLSYIANSLTGGFALDYQRNELLCRSCRIGFSSTLGTTLKFKMLFKKKVSP